MSAYKPCPKCGEDAAQKVYFSWWGSFIGPMILSHVRCRHCGTTYNGNTGKSNNTAILIYCLVVTGIVFGLCICGALVGGGGGNH